MRDTFRKTWDTYVASWQAPTPEKKRALFEKCLDPVCRYRDPLIHTRGWNELEAYMLDFHKQIPGGHFITTYFLAHGSMGIARWEMRNGENALLGEGMSYAEFGDTGNLISMTGFFETPQS